MKIDMNNPPEGATHQSRHAFFKVTEEGVWAWINVGVGQVQGEWVKQESIKALGLQKFKTQAEINEQARSDAIDKLADEIAEYHGLTGARVTHQELAMHLYELNYRRFEIMDEPA